MFFVILKCRTFAVTLLWLSFEAFEVRCPRDKYEMTFWDKYELALQIACSHLLFVHRQSNSNLSMKLKTWKLFLKDWAKLYAWPILRFVEQTFKETFRNKTTLQRHPFAISLSSQPSFSNASFIFLSEFSVFSGRGAERVIPWSTWNQFYIFLASAVQCWCSGVSGVLVFSGFLVFLCFWCFWFSCYPLINMKLILHIWLLRSSFDFLVFLVFQCFCFFLVFWCFWWLCYPLINMDFTYLASAVQCWFRSRMN